MSKKHRPIGVKDISSNVPQRDKISSELHIKERCDFTENQKKELHQGLSELVKPNGYIILEGFSVNNLAYREKNPNVGGPDNANMLYTVEEIRNTFKDFEIIELHETEVELNEGQFHNGLACVVRFIGKKIESACKRY